MTVHRDSSPSAAGYRTLLDALADAPPERQFLIEWGNDRELGCLTFGEFIRLAEAKAKFFRDQGLSRADTIILIAPQDSSLMAAFVGAMMIGATPAMLPFPNNRTEAAKYQRGLAGVSKNLNARLIVVDRSLPEHLVEALVLGTESTVVRELGPNAVPIGEAGLSAAIASDDLAFIQHSSGTSGLQKGVALTHGCVLRQLANARVAQQITGDDRLYSWLPLYHDMGLVGCFLLALVCHVPLVMQTPTDWIRRPGVMLELITRYRCTMLYVPNFALQFLAARTTPEERQQYDLSSLRLLINASEPIRSHSVDTFSSVFAVCRLRADAMQTAYGMAENTLIVTQSSTIKGPRRVFVDKDRLYRHRRACKVATDSPSAVCLISSGGVIPNNRVRIVSDDGAELSDGGVGEILVQSDSMFSGYYRRPDLTDLVLKDGWYWSRDLGFIDDGELFVIGRKNDIIIAAGTNVNPLDVEEIAYAHSRIRDGRAVAFGWENEVLGTQEVMIVAEAKSEADLAEAPAISRAIRQAVVAELGVSVAAIFIKPPGWMIKSTAGKPARKESREKLMAEHAQSSVSVAATTNHATAGGQA